MRKWITIFAVALILSLIAIYGLGSALHAVIRSRTEKALETHFESQIEFSDFGVSLFPRIHVTITGLVMHHQGRTDIPPLFRIRQLSMYANLLSLLQPRPRIALLQLDGLQINTPPRQPGGKPMIQGTDQDLAKKYPVLIEEIRADDVVLALLPAQAEKPPRTFPIHHLLLRDLSFDRPADFHATLTNPLPMGEIDSTGEFGPWVPEDPGETPVVGQYTFQNADMGTLKGINGIMSSKGSFNGPLNYMNVAGVTDIPNFSLRIADHPMALHTEFSAIVDGTNGNTYLKSVTARFLHTTLSVSGQVVDVDRNIKGRTIVLDATSQNARVEDMITLAAKGNEPVMTGSISLKTKIDIPEGNGDLIERLKITGQFGIGEVQFTSSEVQGKIDSLSRRGRREPKDMDITDVASALRGNFRVAGAVLHFSNLNFSVAGAGVNLAGTYNLDSGELDFRGKLILQAKLSQTTTGAKSFFLKALDPFFKGKKAGTVVPIKITGTKDKPSFGLDLGHASD
jgi:hypothetical protein